MQLIDYKNHYFSKTQPYQFLLIDQQGTLLDSCDTLFSWKNHIGKPISELNFFLESIKPALLDMQEELFFPHIRIDQSLYNYHFFKDKLIGEQNIICVIKDISVDEKSLIEKQQQSRIQQLEQELSQSRHKEVLLENQMLQLNNEELERARHFKNLFFSQINHELRSPVNGILGMAEDLKANVNDEFDRLAGIIHAAKHIRNILNDTLDLSKIEAGKMTLEEVDFFLEETLHFVYLSFQREVQNKDLTFKYFLDTQIPPILQGDPTRLSQVLHNLVGNAVKFTHSGTIQLQIKLLDYIDEGHCLVQIVISDTGVGMSPQALSYVFEPYAQADNSIYRIYGGTGLGLSIVKYLVELMNGSIRVNSQENEGTTFEVILPFKISQSTSLKEETLMPSFEGYRALIADDEPSNLLYLKSLMLKVGFEVQTAVNGQQVLKSLEENAFDILLTDLQMPVLDGFSLLEIIKENPAYQQIKIIACSGNNYDRLSSLQGNIDGFLLKPYDKKELWSILQRVMDISEDGLLNLNTIKQVTEGDDKLILDIMDSFLESTPLDIETMKKAAAQSDWQLLAQVAHKIKPTALMLGSKKLHLYLHNLENLCQQKILPDKELLLKETQNTLLFYEQVQQELRKVRAALES